MNELNENINLENSLLVDVRDKGEFVSGHDERSVNIPMGEILAGKIDEIKNTPKENVVFVCASGGRAELARIICSEKSPEKKMFNYYGWENLEKIK